VIAPLAALALFVFACSRLPTPFAQTLLYAGGTWLVAAGLTLGAFLAVSVDDLRDVAKAAAIGAIPGLWVAPGILLLDHEGALSTGIGLILIGAAVAFLLGQRAPHRLRQRPVREHRPEPVLFGDASLPSGLPGVLLFEVLGTLSVQAAIWLAYNRHSYSAAGCVAFGAAAWSRSWVARGGVSGRGAVSLRTSLAALAILLAMTPSFEGGGNQAGVDLQTIATAFAVPTAPFDLDGGTAKKTAGGSGGRPGMPGVILRPGATPRRLYLGPIVRRAEARAPMGSSTWMGLPFSGEYQIFRTSSGTIPEGSPVEQGTPLEAIYGTTNSGPIETQAYQVLDQPLDFSSYGEVSVTLLSDEMLPAMATLDLITLAGSEAIGCEFFGGQARQEDTVYYSVPSRRRPPVLALRIRFSHEERQAHKSVKVAVLNFAFVPKAY